MRLIKLFFILSILISTVSCIEKSTPKNKDLDANLIQSLDGPRVIRDTIIQVVILDTIGSKKDVAVVEQPKSQPTHTTSAPAPRKEREDNYDSGNSGFFDQYRSGYQGDPNRNATVKVTKVIDSEDMGKKAEAIQRSLDLIERQNQAQKEQYQQAELKRQAANEQIKREAIDAHKQQQQQKKQDQQRGKTLNTDLLMNERR